MKKRKSKIGRDFNVGHYWNKAGVGEYGGERQQFLVELAITTIMLPITLYCYHQKGLGIFFVGFLIPTSLYAISLITRVFFFVKSKFYEHDS